MFLQDDLLFDTHRPISSWPEQPTEVVKQSGVPKSTVGSQLGDYHSRFESDSAI